jgi:hypothetical protein
MYEVGKNFGRFQESTGYLGAKKKKGPYFAFTPNFEKKSETNGVVCFA